MKQTKIIFKCHLNIDNEYLDRKYSLIISELFQGENMHRFQSQEKIDHVNLINKIFPHGFVRRKSIENVSINC